MSDVPSLSASGLPAVADDEKTMAMIAHLCSLVFPVIGPAIIWFLKKDSSPFIAYHAIQAIIAQVIFGITISILSFVLNIGLAIFATITFGLGGICFPIVCLAILPIFGGIPWALKAKNGEWTGYPGIAGIGRPDGM